MEQTFTTEYWLQRAADACTQADAIVDPKARAARLLIAEGCQTMAKHAALLADMAAYEQQIINRPRRHVVVWRRLARRATQLCHMPLPVGD
jgi:hypothetical protein